SAYGLRPVRACDGYRLRSLRSPRANETSKLEQDLRFVDPLPSGSVVGLGLSCGGVFERLGNRRSPGGDPGEQQDSRFRLVQLGVTSFQKAHSGFVARESIFKSELAVLEVSDYALEVRQGLLERTVVFWGSVHACTHGRMRIIPDFRPLWRHWNHEALLPGW